MRYSIEQMLLALILVLIIGGIVLSRAHAGILDQIVGVDPLLKKRINVTKMGILVDDTFHVKKYCTYEFVLRVIHKNKMMDEYGLWDRYRADKKVVPIQVHLAVSGLNKEGARQSIFDGDVFTKTSGGNHDRTTLHIMSMILDKGDYQVSLEFLHDIPELKGVEADFEIFKKWNLTCPKKGAVDANEK